MEFLKGDQKVATTATYTDVAGNPALAPAAAITYASSDAGVATVDADGVVTAVGPLGLATITGTVVTDEGATLTASLDFEVTAGGPTTLILTAGTPVPK